MNMVFQNVTRRFGVLAVSVAALCFLAPRFAFAGQVVFEATDDSKTTNVWGRHSDTAVDLIAQQYVPATEQLVCSMSHKLWNSSGSAGPANLTITESDSPWTGAVVATSSVSGADIIRSFPGYSKFPFPCLMLRAGAMYWFHFSNSGPSGFISFYGSNHHPNLSFWQFQPPTFDRYGWIDTGGELTFRLEGPDDTNPSLENLAQFESGGTTPIPSNGTTTKGTVVFAAKVSSPVGKRVRLEVEARQFFLNLANGTSTFADPGTVATTSISRFPDGAYQWQARAVDEDGNASPWTLFAPAGETAFNVRREPVIIVPGIMGSKIVRVSDGQELWPNIGEMRKIGEDNYLNPLILDPLGHQAVGNTMYAPDVIREEFALTPLPVLKQIYMKPIIEVFEDEGYRENKNLFVLPYDWRLDLNNEYTRIASRVTAIAGGSPTGKVDIIAHSMGGLLMRRYASDESSRDIIGKTILLGVPKLGSPKAFKVLTYGDDMGMNKLGIGLNVDKVKDISQNMPGVYELLPSRQYISNAYEYVLDLRNGFNFLDYDESKVYMLENESDKRNEHLIDLADAFHQSLDTYSLNGPNVYNIIGCQNPQTTKVFRIYDDKFDISTGNGDGTVPFESASYDSNDSTNYYVRHDKTGIDHQGLVSDGRTIHIVKSIILGEEPALIEGFSTSVDNCTKPPPGFVGETTIMVSTHSPVMLHVYDAQNRHTGPLERGDIEIGIPGSSYEQYGDTNFVFLPADSSYRFLADGQSAGNFDMKVRSYSGSELLGATTYLNVPLASEATNAELAYVPGGPLPPLQLDAEGDGVFESSIPATAAVSGSSTADVLPPVIEITSPTSTNYPRSQTIPVSVQVTDDASGVAFTEVRLDGALTTSTTLDLFFAALGEHTVAVHAVDNLGNPAEASTTFRVIATPSSTISDIERAYSLGWITKKTVKDSLIRQIKLATRIQQRSGRFEEMLDRILGRLFLRELQLLRSRGLINEKGYNVVREDLEWLLNH